MLLHAKNPSVNNKDALFSGEKIWEDFLRFHERKTQLLPAGDAPTTGAPRFGPGLTGGQIDEIAVPRTPAVFPGRGLKLPFLRIVLITAGADASVAYIHGQRGFHHRGKIKTPSLENSQRRGL
jgi:hypothetical protein